MSPGDTATLMLARHHATNLLVRYLRAVDYHDLTGVLAELGDAEVSFGGPPSRGVEALTTAYKSGFAGGEPDRSPAPRRGGHPTGDSFYCPGQLPTMVLAGGRTQPHRTRPLPRGSRPTDGQPCLTSLAIERTWQAPATDPQPPSPTNEGVDLDVH